MSVAVPVEARPTPAQRLAQPQWQVFAAVLVATLVQGTRPFLYDANHYWAGTQNIVGTVPAPPEAYWELRSALAPLVHAPAAALARLLGPGSDGTLVLLQNAVLIAAFAAFLLPRLMAPWRTPSVRARWVTAGLAWLVLAGFAPFPLVDLYPAIGMLVVVVLTRSSRLSALAVAGLILGASASLRPAYIITAVLLFAVVVVVHRWRAVVVAAAGALAFVPQVVVDRVKFDMWGVLPPFSDYLSGLQAGLGSYVVRYDTVFAAATPQRFFCSPAMAAEVGEVPTSTGGLAVTLLTHVPESVLFALQKVAAALHWPLTTPYGATTFGLDGVYALAVTAITVAGVVHLVAQVLRHRRTAPALRVEGAQLAAIAVGTILMIVASAPEARFALPLVLVGVVGLGLALDQLQPRALPRNRTLVVVTLGVTLVCSVLAYTGLAHPVETASVDQATCAATR